MSSGAVDGKKITRVLWCSRECESLGNHQLRVILGPLETAFSQLAVCYRWLLLWCHCS